ncbi:MAG: RNA-dependent RNA polymerase [Guiyang Phasma-like virus 1]|nr:MAG: RNA-dependent RNA polymerase [Guiyang Phasma-like virus 1]
MASWWDVDESDPPPVDELEIESQLIEFKELVSSQSDEGREMLYEELGKDAPNVQRLQKLIRLVIYLRHEIIVTYYRQLLRSSGEVKNREKLQNLLPADSSSRSNNTTPDLLVIQGLNVEIGDVYCGVNPAQALAQKSAKYKRWVDSLNRETQYKAKFSLFAYDPSGCPLLGVEPLPQDVEENVRAMTDAARMAMIKLQKMGVDRPSIWAEKPKGPMDYTMPESIGIEHDVPARLKDAGEIFKSIDKKAKELNIFKPTTVKEIQLGFNEVHGMYEGEFNTNNPKMNSINMTISKSGSLAAKTEGEQLTNWGELTECSGPIMNATIDALQTVNSNRTLHPVEQSSMSTKLLKSQMRKSNNVAFDLLLRNAHVFMSKEARVMNSGNRDGEDSRQSSWDPLNPTHVTISEQAQSELNKLDDEMPSRMMDLGIRWPYGSQSVARTQVEESLKIIESWEKSYASMMTMTASRLAAGALTRGKTKSKKGKCKFLDFRTNGISNTLVCYLPHDALIHQSKTVPYITISVAPTEQELVKLCGIMEAGTCKFRDELHFYAISNPQRLTVQQLTSMMNSHLKAILQWSLVQSSQHSVVPKAVWAWSAVTPHLSLSYLAENIRYIAQLSMSDFSDIRSFITKKMLIALKSPLELSLAIRMSKWAEDICRMSRSKPVLITARRSGVTMDDDYVNPVQVPSLFGEGLISREDLLNDMYVLIMARAKNMHDPNQGLLGLLEDLAQLEVDGQELDNSQKGHQPIEALSRDSKYCYNRDLLARAVDHCYDRYWKGKSTEIMKLLHEEGSFSTIFSLATARGSRREDPNENGFLIPSTNIQEAIHVNNEKKNQRVIDIAARPPKHFRLNYAQKQQAGSDRAIAMGSFKNKCRFKVCEDIHRALNHLLPNEAISVPGDKKIQVVQSKMQNLIKRASELPIDEGYKRIHFSASMDNQKHSEHDNVDKYKDAALLNPAINQAMKEYVYSAMDAVKKRYVHLSEATMNMSRNSRNNDPDKAISKLYKNNVPMAQFKHGWPQGFLNGTSTCLGACVQNYAMESIPGIMGCSVLWEGDVHSDDSWISVVLDVPKKANSKNMVLRFMNLYYTFILAGGWKLNVAKSSVSYSMCEFLSRFYVDGDQVTPWCKDFMAVVSDLPYRGVASDMPAALSKIQTVLRAGGPHNLYPLMVSVATKQVDALYSLGQGQVNDIVQITGVSDRRNLPISMGGYCAIPSLAMMIFGPSAHNILLLKRRAMLNQKEKVWLDRCVPDSADQSFGTDLDSFSTSWVGPMCIVPTQKSIEAIRKTIREEDLESAEKAYIRRPSMKIIKPKNAEDLEAWAVLTVTSPNFALGIKGSGAMGRLNRVRTSVRGQVWRIAGKAVTLHEYFETLSKLPINDLALDAMIGSINDGPIASFLDWEMTLNIDMRYDLCSRQPRSMISVRLDSGMPLVTNPINDIVLRITDNDSYVRDGRMQHHNYSWPNDMMIGERYWNRIKDLKMEPQVKSLILYHCLSMEVSRNFLANIPRGTPADVWDAATSIISNCSDPKYFYEAFSEGGSRPTHWLLKPAYKDVKTMVSVAASYINIQNWIREEVNSEQARRDMTLDVLNSLTMDESAMTVQDACKNILDAKTIDPRFRRDVALALAIGQKILLDWDPRDENAKWELQFAIERAYDFTDAQGLIIMKKQRYNRGKWVGELVTRLPLDQGHIDVHVDGDFQGKESQINWVHVESTSTAPLNMEVALRKTAQYLKIDWTKLLAPRYINYDIAKKKDFSIGFVGLDLLIVGIEKGKPSLHLLPKEARNKGDFRSVLTDPFVEDGRLKAYINDGRVRETEPPKTDLGRCRPWYQLIGNKCIMWDDNLSLKPFSVKWWEVEKYIGIAKLIRQGSYVPRLLGIHIVKSMIANMDSIDEVHAAFKDMTQKWVKMVKNPMLSRGEGSFGAITRTNVGLKIDLTTQSIGDVLASLQIDEDDDDYDSCIMQYVQEVESGIYHECSPSALGVSIIMRSIGCKGLHQVMPGLLPAQIAANMYRRLSKLSRDNTDLGYETQATFSSLTITYLYFAAMLFGLTEVEQVEHFKAILQNQIDYEVEKFKRDSTLYAGKYFDEFDTAYYHAKNLLEEIRREIEPEEFEAEDIEL